MIQEFEFITDSSKEFQFTYSHSACGVPTAIYENGGQSVSFLSTALSGSTLTITASPTLYSQVGSYSITAKFAVPNLATLADVFILNVVDPCTASNVVFTQVITPSLAPYSINSPSVNYQLILDDNVSSYFNVPNTCDVMSYASFIDVNNALAGKKDEIFTITGDSSSTEIVILSNDFSIISEDTAVEL